MTASLTDRYVYAVTRALPEPQRADIDKELRASIADAVDARVEAGEQLADAERATLTELGDPVKLAGEYAGRPNWLVGPRYYSSWVSFLKLLAATVLPVVFVVLFVINFIEGGIGPAFGGATWVTLTVAVHLAFWVTLFFAIAERSNDTKTTDALDSSMAWTLDSLPQVPERGSGSTTKRLGELIPSVVFLLFFGIAIIWQQFNSVFKDTDGNPIPALDPQLWTFWLPYLLVILVLELLFAVSLYAIGRWNWALAIVNIGLNLGSAIPLVWLLVTHQLLNLPFFDQFGWEATVANLVDPIAAGVVALVAIWDSIDGIVKAGRAGKK
jgi:hypothetical protein